jgi:hypothetical protein
VTRVVVAVVAVVAIAAGAIWLARPKDSGPDPRTWERNASAAFKPLVGDVPDLVLGAREWQAGTRSAEVFSEQVRRSLADFVRTRDRVAALGPSPKAEATGRLYEDSALLYVEVGKIYDVMLRSEAGDVRTQLDLLARRVRELADRVYDRGHAALASYLDEPQPDNVEVKLPEEVPIWPAEGLAPGPPLDDPPGPTADSPPLRQATRPHQSASAWTKDVRAAGIPSDRDELGPAMGRSERDHLRDLARRYIAAAEYLRSRPDPKGERDKSAVLRLGLLVDADAARSAQAATYLADDPRKELRLVAARLVAVARLLIAVGSR